MVTVHSYFMTLTVSGAYCLRCQYFYGLSLNWLIDQGLAPTTARETTAKSSTPQKRSGGQCLQPCIRAARAMSWQCRYAPRCDYCEGL